MKLFHIQPDNTNWGKLYNDDIVASHRWKMPGVSCPACGQTWAMIGMAYPLVDLSILSNGKDFRPGPVNLQTYNRLRDIVENLVPKGTPILPGTDFGPLVGKVKGTIGDFAWVNLWTLLIQSQAYKRLSLLDLRLPNVAVPILQFDEKEEREVYEFQIEPKVSLSPSSYSSPEPLICSQCGRDSRKVEKIVLDRASIPPYLDMFRILNYPTKILVTERFMNAVIKLKLTNIQFSEIEVK